MALNLDCARISSHCCTAIGQKFSKKHNDKSHPASISLEAASAGFYESPHHGNFPKIQILTIEGLLSGAESPKYPDLSQGGLSFKRAKQEKKTGEQPELLNLFPNKPQQAPDADKRG